MQQTIAIEPLLSSIVERLVAEYQPEQVILYGSYAYGTPDESSDLDLFIVKETKGSFYDRWAAVKKALGDADGWPSIQPYVLSPREVERRLAIGDHFVEEILDKGRILYGKATYNRLRRVTEMDDVYAREWLKKAEEELDFVQELVAQGRLFAAFHLQQAVEKFLKAYLISKGWRLDRTHALERLLDEAAKHHPNFAAFADVCKIITGFYTADRYPLEPGRPDPLQGRSLTMAWIQDCLTGVTPLIEFVRQHLTSERK